MKRQTTEWEKTFAYQICEKGLIPKIHKEFIQLNSQKKKKKNRLKNGQRM